ncbi:MAG: heavy metal translocating P-type ATPase metal-binding domain-containing protein [Bacteroidota bacterium]
MEKSCFHCGDEIISKVISKDEKDFCCTGCVSVYTLLKDNNLNGFYNLEKQAGNKPKESSSYKFDFLDIDEIRKKYIDYEDENQVKITLYLPEIHCSSCIYLLENIHKINPNILNSFVNFTKKEVTFTFDPNELKLSELAILLDKIGYEPNFGNKKTSQQKSNRLFLYKFGVAGFAFGSIMLWSFPEYLGIENMTAEFRNFTSYLSLGISIPVLLFSAKDYFVSAYKALKFKSINLDVPITIGIIALYAQSLWSILNGEGPGYMDSFSGFIFFLLIGKWFQNVSYQSLSFERDYKSYFPVAITKIENGNEKIVEIDVLNEGDNFRVRNEEIIPCDAILLSDEAQIDFSFVSGESNLVTKKKGDFIYAGGKLKGQMVDFEVKNKSNRSHLTQLWNETKSTKQTENGFSKTKSRQDKLSIYFLIIVLFISLIAGIAWFFIDSSQITHVVVSVLIVTCPCALALSSPFTLGNIMRLLGRKGLYLKNTQVIEALNETTDIVFDKTGTLTTNNQEITFESLDANFTNYFNEIYHGVQSSTHPLSLAIKKYIEQNHEIIPLEILAFSEQAGKGISIKLKNNSNEILDLKIGSANFIGVLSSENYEVNSYISVNEKCVGRFIFKSHFREGLKESIKELKNYKLHILTGDNSKDKANLEEIFPKNTHIHFEQSPQDKLIYIQNLQKNKAKVLMLGDGLNDSGALKEARVGIAVSEDSFRFTPSSDAIIDGDKIVDLAQLLNISKHSKFILAICLIFSVSYNIFGLSYALSGQLTPLVAAILMPISSITVVFISTFLVMLKKK